MSAGRECGSGWEFLSCPVQCPQPAASGSNHPCAVSCPASRVIIFPPPVVVTFPGPILSTCPQETVLGTSGMPDGGAGASLRSLGAEIPLPEPRSGGSVPKLGPRRAARCSYVFTSRWIHPCRRPSCRSRQPAGNGSEEQIPELEKPETENRDTAKEEKEVLEV